MNNIKEKLLILPDRPGCYLMKDINGKVIYVGKAKILKNRVKSYFIGSHNAKTTKLVSLIRDFDYIITSTETEALVLEMNLIKEYDPKYNILLTDDKTYPYILLSNEKHKRLTVVRNVKKGKGKLFGPYPTVGSARATVNLLNKLYPLRKCRNIPKKACLYAQLNQCLAPCIKQVDKEEYSTITKEISNFLNGNTNKVIKELKNKMITFSNNLEFEQAGNARDLINHVEKIKEKQNVILNDFIDRDIIGFYKENNTMSVVILFMRQGKIIAHDNAIYDFYSDESDAKMEFILKYYQKRPYPKEILLEDSFLLEEVIDSRIVIPKIGDKKKILEMAIINAKENIEKNIQIFEMKKERTIGANEELGKLLNIENLSIIESFDNSHIQGTNTVSAMVVFKDGLPRKKDYRKYKIKTVDGVDDYASMREVIYRRYRRVLMDDLRQCDLIIVDGGIGQINAALESLTSLNMNIPIYGLKKDDKHKTDALVDKHNNTYPIKRNSNLFNFLTRIQDEVHRFAINYHRNLRSSNLIGSILDNIEGVGDNTRNKLLNHFNNLEEMKNSSLEEFKLIGINEKLANKIKEYLFNTLTKDA